MYETVVVIPTFFSHPHRYRLFDQLWHDKGVGKVIVVDNGNSFGIPEKKKLVWSKMQVVRPGRNLNWLGGCNYGADIALKTGMPYVSFLNDDVTLSAGFFSAMRKGVGIDDKIMLAAPRYNETFCRAATCYDTLKTWRTAEREETVPYIDGTCMFMPLRTLQVVGKLDASFGEPGWGADADFSYRVREHGGRVIVTHRAMLWHRGGTTGDKLYGGKKGRLEKGREQITADLTRKYGEDWRRVFEI